MKVHYSYSLTYVTLDPDIRFNYYCPKSSHNCNESEEERKHVDCVHTGEVPWHCIIVPAIVISTGHASQPAME